MIRRHARSWARWALCQACWGLGSTIGCTQCPNGGGEIQTQDDL